MHEVGPDGPGDKAPPPFHQWRGHDLELSLHAQPGARKTEICGRFGSSLKIRLQARPVEGAANTALIAFLADAFGVPGRQVELLHGERGREKRLRIRNPDRQRAETLLNAWDQGTRP